MLMHSSQIIPSAEVRGTGNGYPLLLTAGQLPGAAPGTTQPMQSDPLHQFSRLWRAVLAAQAVYEEWVGNGSATLRAGFRQARGS